MQTYQTLFILSPKLLQEQESTLLKKITSIISEKGGTVEKKEYLGGKKLAYSIQNERHGTYACITFTLPIEKSVQLEREYALTEGVLRSLTTKAYKTPQNPPVEFTEKGIERVSTTEIRADHVSIPFASLHHTKEQDALPYPTQEQEARQGTQTQQKKKELTTKELDEKLEKILDEDIPT